MRAGSIVNKLIIDNRIDILYLRQTHQFIKRVNTHFLRYLPKIVSFEGFFIERIKIELIFYKIIDFISTQDELLKVMEY